MNATALPSASLSKTRQRAAEIVCAWNAWRAARLAQPKLGTVVDAAMFVSLVATWLTGYALLCPAEPLRHHRAVATLLVLR